MCDQAAGTRHVSEHEDDLGQWTRVQGSPPVSLGTSVRGTVVASNTLPPRANGLTENPVKDLNIAMCPQFLGGWKCTLDAAVRHHDRFHATALRCSPHFVVFNTPTLFLADKQLHVTDHVQLED